jgi:hypothetical protein
MSTLVDAIETLDDVFRNLGLLNMNVSLEPNSLPDDASDHVVLELIAGSIDGAQLLVAQYQLEPDYARAARLSPGTHMWSGWIPEPTSGAASHGVRCVLYAHSAGTSS